MAKLPFSVVVVALVWAVNATVADAQMEADPQSPECVPSDAVTSQYQNNVTCDSDFVFNLRVYHQGRLKHYSNVLVVNLGPVYLYTKLVYHSNWYLAAGDELNYRGRATEYGTSNYDQDDWIVTVSQSGGCRADDREDLDGPGELYAIRGPRYNA